MRHEEKKQMD